ncbi:helix-turn-helix domain-containing protein [Candidatus Poribacteria bacterium]|nr:helix-turn-helix domain-containing protein [Candidatus Poribacteria bacterium]
MADVRHDLGEKIRKLRKSARLTQEKLAEKADLSAYYIGQIERGEALPSLVVLQEIAKAFGLTLSQLLDFPSEQETPEAIIEEIVRRLRAGDVPDVEGLSLIREMIDRIALEKKKSSS